MKFPFDTEAFLEVFRSYNLAVWPAQILFFILAVLCLFLIKRRPVTAGRPVLIILSLLWFWMGVVYHLKFFTTINKAAYLFGVLFIIQGALLLTVGLRKTLAFRYRGGPQKIAGSVIILYALIIYPIIGSFSHHVFPYSPTFGLPCPTTIFTFGIFLLMNGRLPIYLVIIPVIWSLIGLSAATAFGMYEDIGLVVSSLTYLYFTSRKYRIA